jgi:predicted dehydrogenase
MAVLFRDDQCFPIRGVHGTSWRKDPALTAGGTLIEHGVHDLDLLTWMFGPIARLRAWEQNRAGHPGVEDYVAVELELATGLRAQLLNLWHDMAGRPSNRRLEIFCRRGFTSGDHDMFGEIVIQRGDAEARTIGGAELMRRFEDLIGPLREPFRDWYSVPYFVQDLAFVEALLEGRDPEPGLAVGLAAHRLAEAVYRSARSDIEVVFETSR